MKAIIASIPPRWLAERRASDASRWDEVWHGELHMPPMPSGKHQDIELDLASFLKIEWAQPNGGLVRHQVNLTTPEDEADWTHNFRIPDIVVLTAANRGIDRDEYMVGPPDAVIEIRSPGDESYEKFEFYADLGVPEVWVIERDTGEPELYRLGPAGYDAAAPGADGWLTSHLGIGLRPAGRGKLAVRYGGESDVVPH